MRNIRLIPPKRRFVDTPAATANDMLLGCFLAIAPFALAVIAHALASRQERDMVIVLLFAVFVCTTLVIAAAIAANGSDENDDDTQ